jgi:hypothetical protein
MATLLAVDGAMTPVTPADASKGLSLDEMHECVNGFIEVVYLTQPEVLVINDTGKLEGMPINVRATLLYWAANPMAAGVDPICGPALLCELHEPGGDHERWT